MSLDDAETDEALDYPPEDAGSAADAISLEMLSPWAGVRPYAAAADTLFVNFSYRDVPEGRFSQVKVYADLPGPVLYLNCPRFTWYREGVPGLGDPKETARAIRSIAAHHGAGRIVCMGFSMGAFGALLHGALAQADQIIAFSGEAILNYPFSRSVSQLQRTPGKFDNALRLLDRRARSSTHVVVGQVEIADMLQAALMQPVATVHMIPGCSHGTVAHLNRKGLLHAVVTELARDGVSPTLAQIEEPFPTGWAQAGRKPDKVVTYYHALHRLMPEPKIAKRVELAERAIERDRVWPNPERVERRAAKNIEARKERVGRKAERADRKADGAARGERRRRRLEARESAD